MEGAHHASTCCNRAPMEPNRTKKNYRASMQVREPLLTNTMDLGVSLSASPKSAPRWEWLEMGIRDKGAWLQCTAESCAGILYRLQAEVRVEGQHVGKSFGRGAVGGTQAELALERQEVNLCRRLRHHHLEAEALRGFLCRGVTPICQSSWRRCLLSLLDDHLSIERREEGRARRAVHRGQE